MIARIKAVVVGRETEVLDKLGIRWREGKPHIRCPYLAHMDKNPSWRWDVAKRAAFCSCQERAQSIFDVIIRVRVAISPAPPIALPRFSGGRRDLIRGSKKSGRAEYRDDGAERPGLSLAEYAAAKALPEDFLRRLGLVDTVYAHKPAVRIQYRASGGTEVAIRFRIALDGADRFRWAKGSKAIPYGLDRLRDARDAGYVVIVEGESAAATLWLHNIPAIGLPGATTWNEES
jgi:hypothetical protein